ncbi:hypothetical protein LPUS_04519 [Lasallia pustulata]|uniref:Uncharacterized protein n=1 Tax=Lasallia pustulata TaxID=136370 RepID=A0A1W5CX27_9LECA|nr:hypothetical protein LPUS_04519 [Lasallia pustulata]
MAKMYTEELKYTGNGDSLDHKLVIFYDICSRADVPEEAYMKAFPTMLKGLALDFYYTDLAMMNWDFSAICQAIINYFEGEEYQRGILSKWNNTSLKSTKAKNDEKGYEECLQILIQDLCQLQRGLTPEL